MVDVAYFLSIFFITLRITSYLSVIGVFFPSGTPVILKGSFALILSLAVVSGVDLSSVAEINNLYSIIFFAVSEVLTGLILGYVSNLVFQAVKMAGAWMDIHAGFSMISILDPNTNTTSTLLGNFSNFIAIAFFSIIDGHHILLNLLIKSVIIVPIGRTIVYEDTLMSIMKTIFEYFALGIEMAIPLVIIIIITDVCLGLISRTVPSIPIMIFGMPIKNVLGLLSYIVLLPLILKMVGTAIHNLENIFWEIFKLVPGLPLVLVFASDDKTEEATPKKKSDSRKKGQIARSKDVGVALTMLVCTLLVAILWGTLVDGFKNLIIYFMNLPKIDNFGMESLNNLSVLFVLKVAELFLPFAVPIMIAGIVASLIQTGFLFTGEPLKPSFGKLNPLTGIKNMISKRSLVDLVKNIIVVTIVSYLSYKFLIKNYENIMSISTLYLPSISNVVRDLVVDIFKQITIVLVIVAAIDYFLQYRMHNKDLRMSKQEVKDEYKQAEGDPQLKGKIKQKQREMGMRRMMQSVADATVVITNPTHLAIALKYEEGGEMEAPKVVAKGADYVAIKIKKLAKESDIPIVENKPLARIMYERVEIDEEIPQDLYQGVAEILAVVMKLKK